MTVLRTVLAVKRSSPGAQDGSIRGLVELSRSLPDPSTLDVVLTLPPASVQEAGSSLRWAERDQRFQEGLWPGSSSEFVLSLLGCLAGLGTWWALPFMTSVHLAGHMMPFSGILHLRELISLLLALTGSCSGAALFTHTGRKPIS